MAGKKPRKGSTWLKPAKVAEQIELSRGNLSHAARQLGVARSALQSFVNRYPELKQLLQDQREAIVDAAENALFAAVTEKEGWAVCFTLKCLGKDRGYIERSEVIGTHTAININYDELTDDELTRIAAGEHPARVLADRRK